MRFKRQFMVLRAQKPPLFSVQMELVFWLTKKLSWKDGLSTLIVFLIGHHLSMMTLSTDYHRWNVICCLTSSQPSLKHWILLSSGKAPGSDAIPAEIYKAGGTPVAKKIFHIMWRKEAIPQEFKDASIIHLFKRKGNPQLCDNHRDISLLSIAGKGLARVLLNRLNEHLEQAGLLPESQCGCRKDREKLTWSSQQGSFKRNARSRTPLHDLYMSFVDLTKAFDTASREGLWKIMAVWLSDQVHSNGEAVPRWYACTGPKRWWVFWSNPCDKWCQARLCTSLNSVQHDVSAMLTAAFQDGDNGIPIRYRFDGKLFNLRRLQAKSKVQTQVLDEFLFADDMANGAPTEEKMQKGVDQVSDSCDNYNLTISIKKTEVVYQPAPGKPYKEPTITVEGQRLQVVDKFTYLGSTLPRVLHIDDEVNARIAKASAAFGRLLGSVWDRSWIMPYCY